VAVPRWWPNNQLNGRIRVFASATDDFCRELMNAFEEIPARAPAPRTPPAEEPKRSSVAFTSSNGQTRSSLADINITRWWTCAGAAGIFMITAPVLQSGIDVSVPRHAP